MTFGQSKNSISLNPTGSYKLDLKTIEKKGETYGYFGDIKIKLLDQSKIAITLFVCKGAPGYHSGALWDTIEYKNNIAVYIPENDSTCKITFTFKRSGITVIQYQSNLNNGCGFGQGVFADGYYRKVSAKIPIIKDPEED